MTQLFTLLNSEEVDMHDIVVAINELNDRIIALENSNT